MRKLFAALCVVAVMASCAFCETVKLPAPDKTCPTTLTEALALRKTERDFADEDFTLQELANLLWAAGGVNRPDGKLVHPVAMGKQDITIYVFTRENVSKYDPKANTLEIVAEGDYRRDTGYKVQKEFVGKAAVNLVYVQDLALWEDMKAPDELKQRWGFAHTGAAMQNVYLYSAAMGWNCVVRGSFEGESLVKLLKLSPSQNITLVQSVGKRPKN
ncbi:MAG: nitroreductase family protein [Synergistaceae bacterium]|nr:nitroreductase family protein [Synergistaceae bacterium]